MIPVYLADDVGAAVQAIIDESGLPKTAYLPDTGLYLQADAGGIALRKAGEDEQQPHRAEQDQIAILLHLTSP